MKPEQRRKKNIDQDKGQSGNRMDGKKWIANHRKRRNSRRKYDDNNNNNNNIIRNRMSA